MKFLKWINALEVILGTSGIDLSQKKLKIQLCHLNCTAWYWRAVASQYPAFIWIKY